MVKRIFSVDLFISGCCALVWITLLALARRAWFPEWDVRWLLVSGVVVCGLIFWCLAAAQVSNGPRPVMMAHRRRNPFWGFVKIAVVTLVVVRAIQILMVSMGAG